MHHNNDDLNSLQQPRSNYGYDDSKVNVGCSSNPINLYQDNYNCNHCDYDTQTQNYTLNHNQDDKQYRPQPSNKDNRLIQLEKDREFLILKNFELENEINRLDQMFSKSFKTKDEFPPENKPKPLNKSHHNINLNHNNKPKLIQHQQQQQPEAETIALRNKVKELEALCRDLQSKVDNTRSKSAIRIELSLWKNRTLELSQNYKDTLHQLNEELAQDKTAFKSAIKKIQTNFVNQVKQIESEYKTQMEKNEKKIAILQKESIELKKKEEKVKEIFLYNFK